LSAFPPPLLPAWKGSSANLPFPLRFGWRLTFAAFHCIKVQRELPLPARVKTRNSFFPNVTEICYLFFPKRSLLFSPPPTDSHETNRRADGVIKVILFLSGSPLPPPPSHRGGRRPLFFFPFSSAIVYPHLFFFPFPRTGRSAVVTYHPPPFFFCPLRGPTRYVILSLFIQAEKLRSISFFLPQKAFTGNLAGFPPLFPAEKKPREHETFFFFPLARYRAGPLAKQISLGPSKISGNSEKNKTPF